MFTWSVSAPMCARVVSLFFLYTFHPFCPDVCPAANRQTFSAIRLRCDRICLKASVGNGVPNFRRRSEVDCIENFHLLRFRIHDAVEHAFRFGQKKCNSPLAMLAVVNDIGQCNCDSVTQGLIRNGRIALPPCPCGR